MKQSKFLLLALSVLLLASCSLARAEGAGGANEDRWIGFYVVPTQGSTNDFYDNPYLEAYGSDSIDAGKSGTLAVPQEVLFAKVDRMKRYTFPGFEKGYSLFCVEETIGGNQTTVVISNMGAHNKSMGFKDEGTDVTLSGTVYYGPPAGSTDWDPCENGTVWHYYRVYRTEDGRVYLDGSGDATNGPMTYTAAQTHTHQINGKVEQEETLSATVALEAVPRIEQLVVTQFDENNAVLQSEDLSLQKDRTAVRCAEGAAWVLVEEIGPKGVQRAAYTVPEGEEPVFHDYVLLDDDGYGSPACLSIYGLNGLQ